MMAVVLVTSQGFGLTVSENEIEPMCRLSVSSSTETTLHISVAGQRYEQVAKFVYHGGAIGADAKMFIESITTSAQRG